MKPILEKHIEQAFVKHVTKLGGMAEKFSSQFAGGKPDRIVTLPGNRIIFVELKRTGGKPTENQLRDHNKRRELGADVRVINTLEQVNAFP